MSYKYYSKSLGLNLIIPNEVINQIKSYSKKHFPKEYGGVLIGNYSKDKKSANIYHIIHPKTFKNSTSFFEANIVTINQEIRRYYEESKGELIYLGEWHSHPNMPAIPSSTDLNAMYKIVKDKGVKIASPILIIAHITHNNFHINPFIFHNQNMHSYEQYFDTTTFPKSSKTNEDTTRN